MIAESVQECVANHLTGAGAAECGGNSKHTGNHPCDVTHHGVDRLRHFQHASEYQNQHTDGRGDVDKIFQHSVEHQRYHNGNKNNVNEDFLVSGQRLTLHVGALRSISRFKRSTGRQQFPCEKAIDRKYDRGNKCNLKNVHQLKQAAFVGVDALTHCVHLRKCRCTHTDGETEFPDARDSKHRQKHAGRGNFAVAIHRGKENNENGKCCSSRNKLDKSDDDQVEEQDQEHSVFRFETSQSCTDSRNHAGLCDSGTKRHHRCKQDNDFVGKTAECGGDIGNTGDDQQNAAGHGHKTERQLVGKEHCNHQCGNCKYDIHLHKRYSFFLL